MDNPESTENETHKILYDFEIQTDHPISPRQPDLIIVDKKKKKKEPAKKWTLPSRLITEQNWKKAPPQKKNNYLDLARELKNMEITVIPNAICALGTVNKRLVLEMDDLEIRGQVEAIQITT